MVDIWSGFKQIQQIDPDTISGCQVKAGTIASKEGRVLPF